MFCSNPFGIVMMMRTVHGHEVKGIDIDPETRCAHYNSDVDIIAIRFKCCGEWYPCFECHEAVAGHDAEVWPSSERASHAILCGACGRELSIDEYLGSGSECPHCSRAFNPGCANHYHLYFA